MDNETSEVAYTDNQWSVYLNLCKEYRQDKSAPTIKVWNKDYQCEYYRGVIIDGEDNIVERCTRTHASYDAALDEAKKKTIVIKRKWVFYNDLMEYIHNYADIR